MKKWHRSFERTSFRKSLEVTSALLDKKAALFHLRENAKNYARDGHTVEGVDIEIGRGVRVTLYYLTDEIRRLDMETIDFQLVEVNGEYEYSDYHYQASWLPRNDLDSYGNLIST